MANQHTVDQSIIDCNPELIREWDYKKNQGIDPSTIARGSIKKYWWLCQEGHSWSASPLHRSRGSGCPFCSGRLAVTGKNDIRTLAPDLAKEWHPTLNSERTPENTKPNSSYVAWWKCSKCGQNYKSKVSHRYSGSACPYCAGKKPIVGKTDLLTLYPALAKEWHPEKNGNLTPVDVTAGSSRKVWWKCRRGHEWETAIHNRTSRLQACPYCANSRQTSFPEQAIIFYLRQLYPKVINRAIYNGVEVDVLLPEDNICIEYDGVFFHKNRVQQDIKKNKALSNGATRIIRIREEGLPALDLSENIIRKNIENIESLNDCLYQLLVRLGEKNRIDINIIRDEKKILAQYYSSKINKSIGVLDPTLAREWNFKENAGLTPYDFTTGSSKKVWWICHVCGHEWRAAISHRSKGKGCPKCARKRSGIRRIETVINKGSQTLQQYCPELIKEWDFTKNSDLSLDQITHGSNKKVWWKCSICGAEWETTVSSRTAGGGCPQCAKEKRKETLNTTILKKHKSLQQLFPEIALDWNSTRNQPLSPETITAKSGKKVWWKCHNCGYEWEDTVVHRTSGRGCRICRKNNKK